MKLKVIGWTSYGDWHFEEGENSLAAHNAILDDVVANGYDFTGWHHQELFLGAPVLSDGKIRRYSQRGWGGLIAESKGFIHPMDYASFAFSTGGEGAEKTPSKDRAIDQLIFSLASEYLDFDEYDFLFEGDYTLRRPVYGNDERYIHTLSDDEREGICWTSPTRQIPYCIYNKLVPEHIHDHYDFDGRKFSLEQSTFGSGENLIHNGTWVITRLTDDLKFIDQGDTVSFGGETHVVKDVDVYKNVSNKIKRIIRFTSNEGYDEAIEKFIKAPTMLKIKI